MDKANFVFHLFSQCAKVGLEVDIIEEEEATSVMTISPFCEEMDSGDVRLLVNTRMLQGWVAGEEDYELLEQHRRSALTYQSGRGN